MAKNSIEAYGAQGKSNVLMFDPNALTIIEDPKHPLYDERIRLPLDEAMVLNIMALGVREPILVWKDPESGAVIVVDGRQRVRHAIEASRRLAERGEPTIQVPGVPQRGDIERMGDVMISMNEARRGDAVMVRARKMGSFQARGYSDDRLAIIFACNVQTVRNTLALLECTKAVQSAVEAGQITLTHVKSLAQMPPEQQRVKVAELVAAGDGAKPHERARRQSLLLNGDKPQMRRKSEIARAAETATGDALQALRWVLGQESTVQSAPAEVAA